MTQTVIVKSLAPILVVDAIEPCLPFWHAVGFRLGITVPEQSPHVFAIVSSGDIEIMLQTRASVLEDTPAVATAVTGSVLYIGVESLEPVLAALPDARRVAVFVFSTPACPGRTRAAGTSS